MFGRRAFSVAGPMEWNSLPDPLRDPARRARSTDGFRSALITPFFCGAKGRLAHYRRGVMRYTNRLLLLILPALTRCVFQPR